MTVTEKRYQVFVSSTYNDLKDERLQLMQTLLALDAIPAGMHMYPNGNATVWNHIKKIIDDSDFYVVLLGSRYGTQTPSGVSYTHMEYVYATTRKKPVLALVHGDPASRAREFQEGSKEAQLKFTELRNMLLKGTYAQWHDVLSLDSAVRHHLPRFLKAHQASGWVQASSVTATAALPVISQEWQQRYETLRKEHDELINSSITRAQDLASGNETYELKYSANVYSHGHCTVHHFLREVSWNTLFMAVGPYLSTPATEEQMREKIAEALMDNALADARRSKPEAHAVTDIKINAHTFNVIKTQLRSLGLIKPVTGLQPGKSYWQQTGKGEVMLAALLNVNRRTARV